MRVLITLLVIMGLFAFKVAQKTNVDTIVYNGTVYTVDQKFTTAQAFSISEGKIIEVTVNADLLPSLDKVTEPTFLILSISVTLISSLLFCANDICTIKKEKKREVSFCINFFV
jgi:hypothetical protein